MISIAVRRLSPVVGEYYLLQCAGFSCCGARAPGAQASVIPARGLSSCGSRAPEHRLSSCGPRAHLLHGTWDPPRPGPEPVSPALAGGLPTTEPPGKSRKFQFLSDPLLALPSPPSSPFSFYPFQRNNNRPHLKGYFLNSRRLKRVRVFQRQRATRR